MTTHVAIGKYSVPLDWYYTFEQAMKYRVSGRTGVKIMHGRFGDPISCLVCDSDHLSKMKDEDDLPADVDEWFCVQHCIVCNGLPYVEILNYGE